MKKNIRIILVVGAVLLVFIIASVINSRSSTAALANATPVQIDTVKLSTIVSKVSADGVVDIKDKESVFVDVPITIKKVCVKEGDYVTKGQLLIEYDNSDRESISYQLQTARVNLSNAKLELKSLGSTLDEVINKDAEIIKLDTRIAQLSREYTTAKDNYEKYKILFENDNISQDELNQYSESLKQKEEALGSARLDRKTRLDSLSDQYQYKQNAVNIASNSVNELSSTLNKYVGKTVAPISGTVLIINGEKGQKTDITKPVVEVGDLKNVIVKADVSEYDSPSVEVGQNVEVTMDANQMISCSGIITSVCPTAVNKTGGTKKESVTEIEISVDGPNTLLKPGYNVETEIETQNKVNIPTIPILALMSDNDDTEYVYLVNSQSKVEKKQIRTGVFSDFLVEVSGLKEGDKVISNPPSKIKEGILVKPILNNQTK